MFVLELDDGAIQLVVGVQSVDQLVPLRVLRPLPVKGILLGVETLDLLQGLVQPGLHGLGLLLVAADLLEVPERLKLLELLLVALQLRLEPIPAELYNTHTHGASLSSWCVSRSTVTGGCCFVYRSGPVS